MLEGTFPQPHTRPQGRLRRATRAVVVRAAWLVAALAVALGAAGIVGATEHFPAAGGQPELTWAADHARLAELDAALDQLRALSTDVVGLGDMARSARGALQQVDRVKLDAAVRTGNADLESIESRTASIRQKLRCGDAAFAAQMETANSAKVTDLFNQGCQALATTGSLSDDWIALVAGSQNAMETIDPITMHDEVAGAAVQLGSQGKYKDAIAKLDETKQYLTTVQQHYDELAKITDVWTLGQWLDRSKTMDDALRNLWQTLLNSNGRVTQNVRDALQAVDQAKLALPPDTRYMSVVLQEIGTAGINQAAISIETARGKLAAAVQGISTASK